MPYCFRIWMLFLFMGFKIKDKHLEKTPSIINTVNLLLNVVQFERLWTNRKTEQKNVMSFQVKGNVIFLTLHTAPYNSRLTINLVVGAQWNINNPDVTWGCWSHYIFFLLEMLSKSESWSRQKSMKCFNKSLCNWK